MSIWDGLTSGLGAVADTAFDFVGSVGGAITSGADWVFDLGVDTLDNVFDEVSEYFSAGGLSGDAVGGGVVDAFGRAGGTIVDSAGKAATDAATNMVASGAAGGGSDFLNSIWEWAKSPEGKQALASGAVALYKQRRQDQIRKENQENLLERDRLNKMFQGSFYGG